MAGESVHPCLDSHCVIGAWKQQADSNRAVGSSNDVVSARRLKLPHIGQKDRLETGEESMAEAQKTLSAREHADLSAARLSPRPGRKLRLSVSQDDVRRARSVSPHSPRLPRPVRQSWGGIDAPLAGGHSPSTSPPRPPPSIQPCFVKKTTSPGATRKDMSPRAIKNLNKSAEQNGAGQTQPVSIPRTSQRLRRSPRLGTGNKSSSTESEDEEISPRGLSPLPPICVSPKESHPSGEVGESSNELCKTKRVNLGVEKQAQETPDEPSVSSVGKKPRSIVKSKSLDSDTGGLFIAVPVPVKESKSNSQRKLSPDEKMPNWLLQDDPAFSFNSSNDFENNEVMFIDHLPDRIPLPDTSTIFQEALKSMNGSGTRPPSRDSDPGDLHVRRSSLVTRLLELSSLRDSVKSPPGVGKDAGIDIMPPVNEDSRDTETRLTPSTFLRVSNWAKRSRKVSAPSKLLTTEQPPARQPSPHRRKAPEVHPPRREFLEIKTDKPQTKNISSSMSDSMLMSSKQGSKNSSESVAEISRPLLSKRTMGYVMKFILSATSATSFPDSGAKAPSLMPGENTSVFPSIPGSISARRSRQRRDSLRIVQQLITEGTSVGDTTEISSFDDLRNCRYIRNFTPTNGLDDYARIAKRTAYHEW